MTHKIQVGQRIRAARDRSGLSQKELGTLVDVSYQSIHQWEKGITEPKSSRLNALARALGVSPSWIQFGQEVKTGNDVVSGKITEGQLEEAFGDFVKTATSLGWLSVTKADVTTGLLFDIFHKRLKELSQDK